MSELIAPDREQIVDPESLWRQLQQIHGLLTGQSDWGAPIDHTSYTSNSRVAQIVRNLGTGGAFQVQAVNGSNLLLANQSGVTIPTLITTTISVTTINAGTVNTTNLTASSAALTTANVTDLNVSGTTVIGDANTDPITLIGLTTFRNAANTSTQMEIDAANNRVIVGSGTPLGSDTTPNLQVVGRLYVAPESANDLAIQVRRSSAATVGWNLGMTSDNDFVFKDDAGSETFRVGDTSSTYQAKVTGDLNVTDDAVVAGDLSADTVAATSSVTAGSYMAAGSSPAASGTFRMPAGGSLQGVGSGGNDRVMATIDSSNNLTFGNTSTTTFVGGSSVQVQSAATTLIEASGGANLGFFGVTAVSRPNVAGVTTGTLGQLQTAMQNFLTALDSLGLINDITT